MEPQKQPEEIPHSPLVQTPPQEPMPPAPGEMPQAPKKSHKTLALFLLLGPTALIVVSFILYAVVNFAFSNTVLPGAESPVQTILNVFLFLAGTVSVLTWLPGIIIGIILLAKK